MALGKVTFNNPLKRIFASAFWAPREEFFHQETNNVPTELEIEIPP